MDIPEPYKIIFSFTEDQTKELKSLFDLQPISQGRSIDQIKTLLEHSDLVIGCYDKNIHKIVGCGRVLTDYAYKAWIFDVRVAEDHRKKGVGSLIVNYILHYPQY